MQHFFYISTFRFYFSFSRKIFVSYLPLKIYAKRWFFSYESYKWNNPKTTARHRVSVNIQFSLIKNQKNESAFQDSPTATISMVLINMWKESSLLTREFSVVSTFWRVLHFVSFAFSRPSFLALCWSSVSFGLKSLETSVLRWVETKIASGKFQFLFLSFEELFLNFLCTFSLSRLVSWNSNETAKLNGMQKS